MVDRLVQAEGEGGGQAGQAVGGVGADRGGEPAVEGQLDEAVDVGPQHGGEVLGPPVRLPSVGLGRGYEVDELVVMVRPLTGAHALAEEMEKQLAAAQEGISP